MPVGHHIARACAPALMIANRLSSRSWVTQLSPSIAAGQMQWKLNPHWQSIYGQARMPAIAYHIQADGAFPKSVGYVT